MPKNNKKAVLGKSTIPDVLCGYFSKYSGNLKSHRATAGDNFSILEGLNGNTIPLTDLLKIANKKEWYVSFDKVPDNLDGITFPHRDVSAIITLHQLIDAHTSITLIEGLLPTYLLDTYKTIEINK